MKIQELQEEEMYCLFAPDGNWQGMTLAPDFASCVGVIKMLHKCKMGQSYHELSMKGFKILPVTVSIPQNRDDHTPFKKG